MREGGGQFDQADDAQVVGLAVAVANIDEVIHIIRSSADPAEARERLQAKSWPVGDMIALIELIADPRSMLVDGDKLNLTDEQARAILGAFLFRKDDVHKPIAVLSGGEKSRLALARILVKPPNLLLMDEPTTHLDIASIDSLVGALKNYEGTLIFISHDRDFVSTLATRIIEMTPEGIIDFTGTYDEYLRAQQPAKKARVA